MVRECYIKKGEYYEKLVELSRSEYEDAKYRGEIDEKSEINYVRLKDDPSVAVPVTDTIEYYNNKRFFIKP